jgi:hypothetical protein
MSASSSWQKGYGDDQGSAVLFGVHHAHAQRLLPPTQIKRKKENDENVSVTTRIFRAPFERDLEYNRVNQASPLYLTNFLLFSFQMALDSASSQLYVSDTFF